MRLTESYLALGMPEEARRAAAVLGANFANTQWYQRAFNLIENFRPHPERGARAAEARAREDARALERARRGQPPVTPVTTPAPAQTPASEIEAQTPAQSPAETPGETPAEDPTPQRRAA
jgi:outer membrane protein assembly factor BamD